MLPTMRTPAVSGPARRAIALSLDMGLLKTHNVCYNVVSRRRTASCGRAAAAQLSPLSASDLNQLVREGHYEAPLVQDQVTWRIYGRLRPLLLIVRSSRSLQAVAGTPCPAHRASIAKTAAALPPLNSGCQAGRRTRPYCGCVASSAVWSGAGCARGGLRSCWAGAGSEARRTWPARRPSWCVVSAGQLLPDIACCYCDCRGRCHPSAALLALQRASAPVASRCSGYSCCALLRPAHAHTHTHTHSCMYTHTRPFPLYALFCHCLPSPQRARRPVCQQLWCVG